MELPCYTSTRKDMEYSSSTVQNTNEANMDESRYKNSINSLNQLTIKKDLNQQKALPSEDKSSREAYNSFNIEKEINSRLKKTSIHQEQFQKSIHKKYNTLTKYLRKTSF
ncbi:hypothetical protein O181_044206 [Austropuccinia psidii MF-1]|uniref:Uncharacterized protein n=1 Tax=Austropuccinia psidii MF-1 TaxID=1389203 RepID=A0A9Q3HGN7_9BASI|nr:hypothetical protein [Austropuccinia psidii MF-1]